MKKYVFTVFLMLVLSHCIGQKDNPTNTVKFNTRFTLALQTDDSLNYTYTIKSQEAFYKTVNLSETTSLFDSIVPLGEIQGIFTYGKLGNNLNVFLMLKSGLNQPLTYELKIKKSNKRKPVKTSVVRLHPNVASTELWPYNIDYIEFSGFKIVEKLNYAAPKPKMDSTCIKDTSNNLSYADSLFSDFIELVYHSFINSKGLHLDSTLAFEHAMNSKDVSRDYFTSIGEDIYPNKNQFKLEKPAIYRHIECPYFETDVEYYYTKRKKNVKVIMLEWNDFESADAFDEALSPDFMSMCFRDKFNRIAKQMTELFGNPVFTEIDSEKNPNKFRDDITWESKDGVNGYLFMFGSGDDFRQIRLAIYKD